MSPMCRWRTTWRSRARSSVRRGMRTTCAAEWVRRHSTWKRRRAAPGRRIGAPPSPLDCPVTIGQSNACSLWRSMPVRANRSCSTATAESTWSMPWRPAVPTASGSLRTASAASATSTVATVAMRTPTWRPATGGCWCCHRSAVGHGTRWSGACTWPRRSRSCAAGGSTVVSIFPDSDSRDAFGLNMMDPSTRPPAARAGYAQGGALAARLIEFWR